MDCKEAEYYAMQYIENTISPENLYKLNIHLLYCDSCSYLLENLQYFSNQTTHEELITNIDISIMDEVRDCSCLKMVPKNYSNRKFFFFTFFSLFLGTILLLMAFDYEIKNFLNNNNFLVIYNLFSITTHMFEKFIKFMEVTLNFLLYNIYIFQFLIGFLMFGGIIRCLQKPKINYEGRD